MDIKEVLLFDKETSGSGIKNENVSNNELLEYLRKEK